MIDTTIKVTIFLAWPKREKQNKTKQHLYIDTQKDTEVIIIQKTQKLKFGTCLVRVSLTYDCSCEAKRLRSSFNSEAKDTTFRRKLCFLSFKSFNKGSTEACLSEIDMGNLRF